ncbi:unnamed protein product [Citrullus colocynthis]|uniref:Uncharacterized protein n=1 Tax=Citrullus colocynthis TaxID=252529 RepID=A0ABP0YMH0_9ROSI
MKAIPNIPRKAAIEKDTQFFPRVGQISTVTPPRGRIFNLQRSRLNEQGRNRGPNSKNYIIVKVV